MKMSFTGSYAPNAVLVAVDQYEEQDFSGRIYTRYEEEPIPFASSLELVMRLEEKYDEWGFPESGVIYRSFYRKNFRRNAFGSRTRKAIANLRFGEEESNVLSVEGELATFLIECKLRQHADWSGIFRIDTESEQHPFHSCLELLRMMDSCVELRTRRAGNLWSKQGV